MMNIVYKETKDFTAEELERLFLSVDWLSGKFPERLKKAMKHSSTVLSAWHGDRLVGLMNAIDDSEMTAYVHYLLIDPQFQKMRIGKELVSRMKTKYKDYLYLLLCCEKKNVGFYEKLGFKNENASTPMQIMNVSE